MDRLFIGFVDSRKGHFGSRVIGWFLDSPHNHVFAMVGEWDQPQDDYTVYETTPLFFIKRPYKKRKDTAVRIYEIFGTNNVKCCDFWESAIKTPTFYDYPNLFGQALIQLLNKLRKLIHALIPIFPNPWITNNPFGLPEWGQCSEMVVRGIQAGDLATYGVIDQGRWHDIDPEVITPIQLLQLIECARFGLFQDVSEEFGL